MSKTYSATRASLLHFLTKRGKTRTLFLASQFHVPDLCPVVLQCRTPEIVSLQAHNMSQMRQVESFQISYFQLCTVVRLSIIQAIVHTTQFPVLAPDSQAPRSRRLLHTNTCFMTECSCQDTGWSPLGVTPVEPQSVVVTFQELIF